jgi:hypothetical protein
MVVRTEGAMPTAWVYVDVAGRDIGSYVTDAQRVVGDMVTPPAGYSIVWSGQYEYMQRAAAKMKLVIPATLAIIFLLLYFNFKSVGEALIVMASLPFALVGGIWFIYALGYNWSVAVAIGFIALAGVAAETGVVMLIYLDNAWRARLATGDDRDRDHGRAASDSVGKWHGGERHEAHRRADGGGNDLEHRVDADRHPGRVLDLEGTRPRAVAPFARGGRGRRRDCRPTRRALNELPT